MRSRMHCVEGVPTGHPTAGTAVVARERIGKGVLDELAAPFQNLHLQQPAPSLGH